MILHTAKLQSEVCVSMVLCEILREWGALIHAKDGRECLVNEIIVNVLEMSQAI